MEGLQVKVEDGIGKIYLSDDFEYTVEKTDNCFNATIHMDNDPVNIILHTNSVKVYRMVVEEFN